MRTREKPASLACYTCRRKHLKCDGATPICARCAATSNTCTYLPSRRGLPAQQQQQQQSPSNETPLPTQDNHTFLPPCADHVNAASPATSSRSSTSAPFTAAERAYLIQQYYSHFHPSHPMLVPHACFQEQRYPEVLVVAICVVGQHFGPSRPSLSVNSTALSMAITAGAIDSLHRIQSFVLLALVFFGSHDMSRANDCICRAVLLAQEAGLDRLDSDPLQHSHTPMQQESARRTWWEVYMVDALLALLESRPPRLATQTPAVLPRVPCTEEFYELGGDTGPQQTYADFESRYFLPDPVQFSPHFYRIEAVNIVRRVGPLYTRDHTDPQELEAIGSMIASWSYHLPESSFSSPGSPGELDRILLQAHLLVQIASIFLHFPRSNLPSSAPSAIDITCLSKGLSGMENSAHHATKAIAASREICKITSLIALQEGQSPMAICGYLLGCAVQLSVASDLRMQSSRRMEQSRSRVILMLGALKHTGRVWPAAQSALQLLQPFARSVFSRPYRDQLVEDGMPQPIGSTTVNESSGTLPQINMNNQHDLDTNLSYALQDNTPNVNYFDFFQSTDLASNFDVENIQ